MAEEAFIKTRFYSYGQSGAGSYLYHGSGRPFFDAESEEDSHASDHVSTIDCQYSGESCHKGETSFHYRDNAVCQQGVWTLCHGEGAAYEPVHGDADSGCHGILDRGRKSA